MNSGDGNDNDGDGNDDVNDNIDKQNEGSQGNDDEGNNDKRGNNDDKGGNNDDDSNNNNGNEHQKRPQLTTSSKQNFDELQKWHLKIPSGKHVTDTVFSIINKCFEKMATDKQIIFHPSQERTRLRPEPIDSMQKFPCKKDAFSEFFYFVKITKDGRKNRFNGIKVNIWIQCSISAAQLKR